MRNECSIVRDILPLYAENMLTSDTAEFVEEHLKGCETCGAEYEKIKEPQKTHEHTGAAPLINLSKKLKAKKIQTIAFTALFVIASMVCVFAIISKPFYLPYSEGLVKVEQFGDNRIILSFDESATDFSYSVHREPEGGDFDYCYIEAWTSVWDSRLSKQRGNLSTTLETNGSRPLIIVYSPNDGTENIRIAEYNPAAENRIVLKTEYEKSVTLPRLAPGYYLILANIILALIVTALILIRKKAAIRTMLERIGLYPIAYIISHYIVVGKNGISYSMSRDFYLILLISILIYSALLLAHNLWRLKKEIRESHSKVFFL